MFAFRFVGNPENVFLSVKAHMIKHAIDLLIIFLAKDILSHDVTSGSVKTPCNKIYKPLVVNRFSNIT